MRFLSFVLSFVLTLASGVGLAHAYTLAVEWRAPAFTEEEATAMLGRRVRNIYWSDQFAVVKCPSGGGKCSDVLAGEGGRIVGIKEVSPKGRFFVVVRWDMPGAEGPMLSGFGRMTRRVFLDVE